MTVDEILGAIESFAPALLEDFLGRLVCLPCLPIEALVKTGVNLGRVIEARNEKAAMQAAVAAVNAEVQAEQAADAALIPTGGL